ncbi:MAG: aminotransferase class V-fold PLP-dependent enzyme [Egibacteraceae bacterium]
MVRGTIYLDYQATTPLDPRVLEAMLPYLTDIYGNPSSPHVQGRQAAEAIRTARRQVQTLIGAAHQSEIVFTSGATESNHLALIGAAVAAQGRGDHIVTTVIEHKSVLAAGRLFLVRGRLPGVTRRLQPYAEQWHWTLRRATSRSRQGRDPES